MTNLLSMAVLIIATNSSELKTNVSESANPPGTIWNYTIYGNIGWRNNEVVVPPPAPAEKWVTTTVTKEDTLNFVWLGQTNLVTHSELVSSNTIHLRVKQEWGEIK